MEVTAIEERYVDRRTAKAFRGVEPAESSTENDNAMGDTFRLAVVARGFP